MSRNPLLLITALGLAGCSDDMGLICTTFECYQQESCPLSLEEMFALGTLDVVPLAPENNFLTVTPNFTADIHGFYHPFPNDARYLNGTFSYTVEPITEPVAYRLWLDESTLTDPAALVPEADRRRPEVLDGTFDLQACDRFLTQRQATISGALQYIDETGLPQSIVNLPTTGMIWGRDNNGHDAVAFNHYEMPDYQPTRPSLEYTERFSETDPNVHLDFVSFGDGSWFEEHGPLPALGSG